jgi:signal transduction histidine kinase
MILRFRGYKSPYFMGMVFVIMLTVSLYPSRFWMACTLALLTYLIYLIPLLVFDKIIDLPYFISMNVFTLALISIALVTNIFCRRAVISELVTKRRIERYSQHLEAMVDRKSQELINNYKLQTLGTMASGLAHDFSNIIATLRSFVDLVMYKKNIPDDLKESMKIIDAEVHKGAGIINRLREYARKIDLKISDVNINDLVRSLINTYRSVLPGKIRIDCMLSDGIPALKADRELLDQVLTNLVINAKDAMHDGGIIMLSTDSVISEEMIHLGLNGSSPVYAHITVEDTGVGIPKDHLPHVFDPFFTTKEKGKGSGIGLAMVQSIIREHQGHITVESEENKGARFHIYLPLS